MLVYNSNQHSDLERRRKPMTYVFDGKQYIAAAVGSNIMAFGLVP
jgi:hypothetical protein